MDRNPELYNNEEDEGIIKNFGIGTFNSMEEGDLNNEWDDIAKSERGIFDGTAEQERELSRQEIISHFIK